MSYKLEVFQLETTETRFYANGRHQAKIKISVLKKSWNGSDYVKSPLTQTEKDSLKLAAWNDSLNYGDLVMPSGWSTTDTYDDRYKLGTLNDSASYSAMVMTREQAAPADEMMNAAAFRCASPAELAEIKRMESQMEPRDNNNVPEVFYRYVSGNTNGTNELMAVMKLEDSELTGDTLTVSTNFNKGDMVFNSKCSTTALQPYAISSSELDERIALKQDQTYDEYKPDIRQIINVYYWTLPYNLNIVSRSIQNTWFYNLGSEDGDRYLSRGRAFEKTDNDANARDNMSGGCVQDYSYSVPVGSTEIVAQAMYVTGCSWTSGTYSEDCIVSIVDDYGCDHKFAISAANDKGNALSINSK